MENSNKDKLRSLTLGSSSKFKTREVEVNGGAFQVKQPSVKERNTIRKASMQVRDGKFDFDLSEFQLNAVIALTCDPSTGDRVFEDTDREVLESLPCGGWYDELGKVAMELCNVGEEDEVKKD